VVGYRRIGTGPDVLVLVPSSFANYRQWDHIVSELETGLPSRYSVVIFDYPGIGLSAGMMPTPPTLGSLAGCITKVLDQEKIKRAHLFAYSLGGLVAQAFAIAHPERVASLFSYGTPELSAANQAHFRDYFRPHIQALSTMPMQSGMLDRDGFRDFFDRVMVPHASSPGEDNLIPRLRRRISHHLAEKLFVGTRLKSVYWLLTRMDEAIGGEAAQLDRDLAKLPPTLPVGMAVGSQDRVTPPPMTDSLRARIPHAKVFHLPGLDHRGIVVFPRQARKLARTYMSWLEQHAAPPKP
jgi:pimeloyl-ACP methyl ester carboxylesterase